MVFVALAEFSNEGSNVPLRVLTGPDTLTSYKYIDPTLPAGTGAGQLDEAANLLDATGKANVWDSAEVFDIGAAYDGPEIELLREREARLQAQFVSSDIRQVPITVSIIPVNPAYV